MESKETPFALPLKVNSESYIGQFVIHDAKWLRVAAFRKTQTNALARAEYLRDAINSYDALTAENERLREAAEAALSLLNNIGTGKWAKTPAGDKLRAALQEKSKCQK